jgi:hypothetical protein
LPAPLACGAPRTRNDGQDVVSDVFRELRIELFEPGADGEVVDGLASDIRLELLQLDVDSVSPVALGPAPEEARGWSSRRSGRCFTSRTRWRC